MPERRVGLRWRAVFWLGLALTGLVASAYLVFGGEFDLSRTVGTAPRTADGSVSYIEPDFPPGTAEVYVEAGTLLGYQGDYSGNPLRPVGVHLLFSIVLDDGRGQLLNELEIENTLDPSPYLGLPLNANNHDGTAPVCQPSSGMEATPGTP